MALVFEYKDIVNKNTMPAMKSQESKAAKALEKKKLPKKIIDEFFAEIYKSGKLKKALTDLNIIKMKANQKTIGADALMNAKSPVTKKVFATVVKSQRAIQFRNVSMEIHIKSGNLQLWYYTKGGKVEVLVDKKSKL